MLYDPKWEQKTEIKKPSMADFIAWLETKNPAESYNFEDCNGFCLAAQYMSHCGVEWNDRPLHGYRDFCEIIGGTGRSYDVPVLTEQPHTFGAALERARKLAV